MIRLATSASKPIRITLDPDSQTTDVDLEII